MDLPDDRFTAAASFHMLHHIRTAEEQDAVFSELARVLETGGVLVAADGVENESIRLFHADDVYNPVDPEDSRWSTDWRRLQVHRRARVRPWMDLHRRRRTVGVVVGEMGRVLW